MYEVIYYPRYLDGIQANLSRRLRVRAMSWRQAELNALKRLRRAYNDNDLTIYPNQIMRLHYGLYF